MTALGLGAMSGPGISCRASRSPAAHPQPCRLLRGTMATIIYWMSASFPHIHPGWPSQGHRGCAAPPVSSLRGGSGKIISGEHLDHLFRAPGVSRKPNCPHLCAGVLLRPFRLGMSASRGRCTEPGVRGPLHKLTLMPHEGLSVNSVKVRNV